MVAESVVVTLAQAGIRVTAKGEQLMVGPRESVTPEIAELVRGNRDSLLAAAKLRQGSDDRMNEAWDALMASPTGKYHLRFEEVDSHVIASLAIRDVGTCELSIPAERFDPYRVISAMEAAK